MVTSPYRASTLLPQTGVPIQFQGNEQLPGSNLCEGLEGLHNRGIILEVVSIFNVCRRDTFSFLPRALITGRVAVTLITDAFEPTNKTGLLLTRDTNKKIKSEIIIPLLAAQQVLPDH